MSFTPANRSNLQPKKTNSIMSEIENYKGQIEAALPSHITPKRMLRIIMTEVRKTPKLAEVNRASFFGAIIQCAQLGLEPGAGLGHAYILPYKNEAQLIIGYQGMIDLAERSGKVTIDAHVIYENDDFDFNLGLNPHISHIPCFNGERGKVKGAYAVARYSDGRTKFRVLSKDEIDQARRSSSSGNSKYSPWTSHYDEMARKTAVRRLFKMLPKSVEMARAQELEDKQEIDRSQNLADIIEPREETFDIEPIEEENTNQDKEEKKSLSEAIEEFKK